jgi:hypothetical protein
MRTTPAETCGRVLSTVKNIKIMATIKAVIEKSEDGLFSIYTDTIPGVYGSGLTEEEAKKDFNATLEEQAQYYCGKHGSCPDWSLDRTVEYAYNLTGFFLAFPFINASEFAKAVGINPSLMRQYKNGIAFASEKQRQSIQQSYNKILKRMQSVTF